MTENTTKKGLTLLLAALIAASAVFGAVGTVAAASGAWDTETTASASTTEIGSKTLYTEQVNGTESGKFILQTDGVSAAKADLEVRIYPADTDVSTPLMTQANWTTVNSSAGQYAEEITYSEIRSELPYSAAGSLPSQYRVEVYNTASDSVVASASFAVDWASSYDAVRVRAASGVTGVGDSPKYADAVRSEKKQFGGIMGALSGFVGTSTLESLPVIGTTLADVQNTGHISGDVPVNAGNTTQVTVNLQGTDAASALKASMDTTSEGDRIPAAAFVDGEPVSLYDSKAPSDTDAVYGVVTNNGSTVTFHNADGFSESTLNYEINAGQAFPNGVGPNQDTLFDGLGVEISIPNPFGDSTTNSTSS